MLRYALQNYRTVANSADAALRHAVKRFPSLISAVLPTLLAALGGLPLPSTAAVREGMAGSRETDADGETEYTVDVKLVQELASLALGAASQGRANGELSAAGLLYHSHMKLFKWTPSICFCCFLPPHSSKVLV